MKTKISRIGKSSLSIILSIMMIISTMLVGVINTSATSDKFTSGDTIYFDINSSSVKGDGNIWSSGAKIVALFYYQDNDNRCYETKNDSFSDSNVNNKKTPSSYTNVSNVNGDIYKVTVPAANLGSVRFLRLKSDGTEFWNYSLRMSVDSKGTKNCVKLDSWDNNSSWSTYTVQNPDVASSVSLTATPSPAEKNNPITLTATLSSKASGLGDVTYTFTKTSDGNGTFKDNKSTVTTSATSATATFTPSGTGSYTFKVVASATGYTSVENTVTVNVTAPEEYYLTGYMGGNFGTDKGYKFTETATKGIYSCKITPTADLYALITDTSTYYGPGKSNVVLTEKQWSEQGTTVKKDEYNKWGITGQSGKEIIIYWDSANEKIKWESAVEKYTLTLNVGNNGKGKIDSETQIAGSSSTSKSLEKGSSYEITVTPNTGYEVDAFTVGGVDKKSSLTNGVYSGTNITADTTVAVTFKQSNYTVTKGTESNGTFTVDKTSAHYNDTITVSGITPANGYLVSEVKYTYGTSTGTASLSSDKKSATFKMPASNVTVNVTFVLDNYAITKTVDPSTSGTITVKKNTTEVSTYKMGDTLTLTATPQSGYKFKSFTVTGGITATITTDTPLVNIASNGVVTYNLSTAGKYGAITITANFEKIVYTGITGVAKYSTTGADGSYTNTLPDATVTVDSSGTIDGIAVTAPEVAGYKFAGFSATNGTLTDVNTTNRTAKYAPTSNNGVVTAQYKKIYSVTTTAGDHGSISASTTSAAGEQYTVTVTPASGYQIKSITVNGTPITTLTSAQKRKAYTYTGTATSDETVAAEFEEITAFTITASSNNTSWGTVVVNKTTAEPNDTVTVTATEVAGTFQKITVKTDSGTSVEEGTSKTLSFTMPESDVIITATFTEYQGKSDYYYDGYDASGNSLSDYKDQQLSESKIGGVAYGYYSPNRTGNDQLFTIKKSSGSSSPSGTRYVYFTNSVGWSDLHCHFWVDKGENKTTWPGTKMVWIENNKSNQGVYRVEIPAGANRCKINDGKQTGGNESKEINLADTNGAYYLENNDVKQWSDPPNDAGLGSASSSATVYYWDSGVYINDAKKGSNFTLQDHGANNKKYAKLSTNEDYYIIVYYPGETYTINGESFTVPVDKPIVVASTTLPGVVSNKVTVYAKDGTIRAGYQKYADMADTKVTSGATLKQEHTYYGQYVAKKGATITIQTTIATGYRNDYYVKAFCINGDSYGVITKSEAEAHKSDGVYTCTYAIPDADNFTGNTIEITPIYYYFDDEDTVTFYVEGRTEELADVAGDTLSVYAFYQGGADATVAFNAENMQAFGGYPGQPLVKDGGRFYMQVPKHLNGNTSRPISGITLSNYVWDDIHSLRVENGTGNNRNNIQTYDYNCFLRINDVKKARDIFFEFKYRNGGNNKIADIGGKITDENVSCLKNGWEDLTNHLGGLVDIYNDNISGSTDGKEPLHVVSNGYIDNGSQTYATEWNVYAPASKGGNLIGVISPTALLAENADGIIYGSKIDTYKATYNALEKYKGYPVRITYEKAMWNDEGKADGDSQGGEKALRIDGRWTYITNDDFAEGKVEIQYANTLNDEFVTDSFTEGTNQGSQTGTKAYFTNEDFYHETSSGSIRVNPDEYFTFAAETDPDNQYMFVGWWKRSVDGTYVPMTEARSHMVGNDTFVARFIKTPDGNLSVKHQLYNSDSPVVENMPQIYGGQGNCYVKVEIMDGDTVIATFGNTTSATSVSVDQKYIRADSTYKMRITLTTVMKGKNTFEDIYRRTERIPAYTSVKTAESDEDGISTVISGNVATTVRYYPIDRLFKDSDGNLQDVQIVKTANYYSNIKTVNKDFKITYYFYDRFGTEQKYVVKGGLPEGQNALEEQDLIDNAPYEKNFIKDFAWNFNKTGDNCYQIYEQDGVSTAVVHSDQPTKKVYVSYSSSFKTEGAYDKILEFEYGSLVTVDGKKLNAPETNPENDKEKFSHWEICNDDGDFVTNVYSRWFNYVLYDNYLIKPIYKQTPDSITTSGISATIQFLEYSRNQWTDDYGDQPADGSFDRIFADFALSFTKNGELIKPADNECGIVLAVGPNLDTFGNTNLANIKFNTDDAKLKDFILNGTAYESDGANGTVKAVKSSIVKKLDNKNRVELYNRFKNSPANTDPVIKAYSYIIVDGEVTLSKPVYISLKDESIKTYTHSVG